MLVRAKLEPQNSRSLNILAGEAGELANLVKKILWRGATRTVFRTSGASTAMGDETLVLDDLTRYGLRRMHIMRCGKAVEARAWMERIGGEVDAEEVRTWRCYEELLDVHHLWFYWHARELVEMRGGRRGPAVLWWVGEQPARFAIDCAASLYLVRVGRWPNAALMSRLPAGAEAGMMADARHNGSLTRLPLKLMEWVPKRFVVVCEEARDDER